MDNKNKANTFLQFSVSKNNTTKATALKYACAV